VTYGMSLGLPVYLVDSSGPIERVAAEVAKRFGEPRDANDTGRERDQ
jgi:hypothetical protein